MTQAFLFFSFFFSLFFLVCWNIFPRLCRAWMSLNSCHAVKRICLPYVPQCTWIMLFTRIASRVFDTCSIYYRHVWYTQSWCYLCNQGSRFPSFGFPLCWKENLTYDRHVESTRLFILNPVDRVSRIQRATLISGYNGHVHLLVCLDCMRRMLYI